MEGVKGGFRKGLEATGKLAGDILGKSDNPALQVLGAVTQGVAKGAGEGLMASDEPIVDANTEKAIATDTPIPVDTSTKAVDSQGVNNLPVIASSNPAITETDQSVAITAPSRKRKKRAAGGTAKRLKWAWS